LHYQGESMALKPGKRQINSERTKQKIYHSAIGLFHRYGYENVSVEDIVRVSETSVGSFYHFFKSKDELPILFMQNNLQAAFEEYEKEVLIPAREKNTPVIDQICDFLFYALKITHDCGEEFLRVAMIYLMKDIDGEISYNYMFNPDRAFARICRQLIREGQEAGEFRDDKSVDELFTKINIFSNGIDQQCYLQSKRINVQEVYGDYLLDFTRSLLLK
jgi:AcrR family transcriptional regulator